MAYQVNIQFNKIGSCEANYTWETSPVGYPRARLDPWKNETQIRLALFTV
jgi:hypothetical protein